MSSMEEQVVRELEISAEVLLAPPNLVTSEQRRTAEEVFLNFHKAKSPFNLCRFIFETSKVDYVQFQAASVLKQSIIREWPLLNKSDVKNLQTYLLQYVIQHPGIQSFVREQLLLVVAIMVKRAGVDDESEVLDTVLNEVSNLISSGESSKQTVGCSVLTALLNEYSSTTRSSDVGLTWETHLVAKKRFEVTDLKRIFQYCLQGLNELAKITLPVPNEALHLFKKFLIIAEQVLSWNFQFTILLPRKLIGLFEAQQCPTLRPGPEWGEILLNPSLVEVFFKLHWQLRDIPDLCHHTLQCLNQLASLNGVLMGNKEDRCQYLSWFLDGLLKLLTSGKIKDHEALGLSSVICRLGVYFPPVVLVYVPAEVLKTYLLELVKLTCHLIEGATLEEALHKDDQIFMEALEHLLDSWVTILQDAQTFPKDIIQQASIQICNCYLQCHLAPPDGRRGMSQDQDNEEIDDAEEDDRSRFKEQLAVIGLLGRHALDHCVPLLTRLLENRVSRLHGQLQRIHQQALTLSDSGILDALNEDIHWLVLIAGHVLAPVSEGETSLIPLEVTRYCIQQAGNVSIETTLQVLVSPSHHTTDIPGAEQRSDPVVRLISAVFQMCEVERRALEANLAHLLSPEVALTLVWFIRRWSVTYLLPNESYYTEMSLTLTGAFGRDSEAGLWTLNFLLSKLLVNLSNWGSEPKLASETAQTLVALLNNVERGRRAITCESLVNLLKKQSNNEFHLLPTAAKRSVLKALVIVGTANKNDDKDHYWELLLKPLQERFRTVVYNESFKLTYQTEQVKSEVLVLIESFIGVADGCTIQNLPRLFPFLHPIMEELVKLLEVYHNYSDVVSITFQFFCTAAKRVLCFLNEADSKKLYECCLNMIQTYAKHNRGKLSREASAEEEQYQDILALMELLTDLLSKDFIDFAPSGMVVHTAGLSSPEPQMFLLVSDSNQENNQPSVSAADIALFGLNIIMPLMTIELLKFPSLCLQYFKFITFVCEIYPNKILQLPETLFKSMIGSVELGLVSFTPDVTTLCLDFISVLGVHMKKTELQRVSVYETLQPFLKIIMDMVILQPLDSDLTQTASGTLFTLICCYQDKYKELVQSLINSQTDPACGQRLVNNFNALTADVELVLDRQNRAKFKENFEKFITDVRGFLCVK